MHLNLNATLMLYFQFRKKNVENFAVSLRHGQHSNLFVRKLFYLFVDLWNLNGQGGYGLLPQIVARTHI